uniref:Uncharacterized protein n=1 Tax=candidate division CPR3 bacterium TaxID=2268181 RepID=A0A7C4QWX2_UNCC3
MKKKPDIVKIEKNFSQKEIEEIKNKIINSQKSEFTSKEWFLIIKPIGKKYQKEIKEYLFKKNINIAKELKTKRWREMALPLYIKDIYDPYFEYVLYRNEFFKTIEGEEAIILYLKGVKDKNHIYTIKKEMRKIFTVPNTVMIINSMNIEKNMEINTFHIPDEEHLEKEHKVLYNFLKEKI